MCVPSKIKKLYFRLFKKNIFVLVEDQTTSVSDSGCIEKRNRGLGKYWQHIPAVLILMEKNTVTDNNGCSMINIIVSKQNIPYISKSCQININVLGVS